MTSEERYVLVAEWYDTQACMLKGFFLQYFPFDGSIDIFDSKSKRVFLKRLKVNHVTPEVLYIGSVITIYSRQFKIVDYAD
jgi:nucleoside-diphosphate kinase